MQTSFFDLENRCASLSEGGDPLEQLDTIIDWEIFRPILERINANVRYATPLVEPNNETQCA